MAFTNAQRADIRAYLGYSKLFESANSILENAMTTIDNLQDSGATQARMVNVLTQLNNLDTLIATNQNLMLATEVVNEVSFDAIRADAGYRRIGRALISQLCIPLSMRPASDYYSPTAITGYHGVEIHGTATDFGYE